LSRLWPNGYLRGDGRHARYRHAAPPAAVRRPAQHRRHPQRGPHRVRRATRRRHGRDRHQADVTRQTVYAHFPSRDALLAAVIETAAAEYHAALDAGGLDTAPPADALARFLDIGWRLIRRYPLLLNPTATRIRPDSNDPHDLVPPRLERLIQRGQRTGDFDPSLHAAWLVAAVIGLQHAAAAEVADGRLTADDAAALCRESALRLCGAAEARR
jgi:AcrR family transcriptional regulator